MSFGRRVRNLKICLLAMLLSGGAQTGTVVLAGPPPFAAGLGSGIGAGAGQKKCEPSVTTASGTHVLQPSAAAAAQTNSHKPGVSNQQPAAGSQLQGTTFCSGDLIFEDTFDTFDLRKWQHEITLSGGGNWEFQWYTNNRSNSFCEEGFLHLRPTLTADVVGEQFLHTGRLDLHAGAPADACTDAAHWGCERTGTMDNPLNPVRSARLRTADAFRFKYGRVEVSAKMPAGDWLWPAVWLMPRDNVYGSWPASGEIDLVELRGNRELLLNGLNVGGEQLQQTLHFGPYPDNGAAAVGGGAAQSELNAANAATLPSSSAAPTVADTLLAGDGRSHQSASFVRSAKPAGTAWSSDVHRFQMEWTPEKITFSVDDVETGTVAAAKGFWARGGFEASAPGADNPWRLAGTPMAPFDQEFYLIINLAVGGVNYFPDEAVNAGGAPKPWSNQSPTAARDFWAARNGWLPTWNLEQNLSREASLIVDYVRVWAL